MEWLLNGELVGEDWVIAGEIWALEAEMLLDGFAEGLGSMIGH